MSGVNHMCTSLQAIAWEPGFPMCTQRVAIVGSLVIKNGRIQYYFLEWLLSCSSIHFNCHNLYSAVGIKLIFHSTPVHIKSQAKNSDCTLNLWPFFLVRFVFTTPDQFGDDLTEGNNRYSRLQKLLQG